MYASFPFPPSLLELGTAHDIPWVFFCGCGSVHGLPQSHTPLGNHPNMLVSPQQVDLRVLLHQRGRCHHSSLPHGVWGLRSSPTSPAPGLPVGGSGAHLCCPAVDREYTPTPSGNFGVLLTAPAVSQVWICGPASCLAFLDLCFLNHQKQSKDRVAVVVALCCCCCYQISNKKQLKGRGVGLALSLRGYGPCGWEGAASRRVRWQVTLHPQPGHRKKWMLAQAFSLLFSQSIIPAHAVVAPAFRASLPFAKDHHKHTRRYVSLMILNTITLTMKINHHKSNPFKLDH